jgi:hypothetical protein
MLGFFPGFIYTSHQGGTTDPNISILSMFFSHWMPTLDTRNTATLGIIKATVGQIDDRDESQAKFAERRQVTHKLFPEGRKEIECNTSFRARGNTTPPAAKIGPEAYCNFCELA